MFFSGEDTVEHVIKKKLRAQHADMSRIMTVSIDDSTFDKILLGSKYLERLIGKYKPALCVFDPLQSFLKRGADMKERNTMRQILRHLIRWGKQYGTTFLIVMHTNKQINAWGRNRMADSADLWDIARSVLMVGDTEDEGIKYISHEKSNYGRTGKTILFQNEKGNPTFYRWATAKDKDFVMQATKSRNTARGSTDIEEVSTMIMSALEEYADGLLTSELTSLIEEAGYKKWVIDKAKTDLKLKKKIKYIRSGMSEPWRVKKA